MESFLGSGDVYMDRLDADGSPNGFFAAGNVTKFAIQPDSEVKEQIARGRDNYGQVLASVVLPKPAKLSMDFSQLDRKNIAINLFGEDTDIDEAGDSVTDEEITVLTLDNWQRLAHRNVDAESVVVEYATGSGDPVEATVDEDYEIIARTGMIRALSTGNILAGDVMTVSYDYAASTGWTSSGMTESMIKLRLFLDGKNEVNGKDVEVTVHEVRVAAKSVLDFLSADFASMSLEGTPVTPDGMDEPFTVKEYD
jgi:hypothetical protein